MHGNADRRGNVAGNFTARLSTPQKKDNLKRGFPQNDPDFAYNMEMKAPSQMRLDGNIAENWKKFIQRFMLYLEATEKTSKPDKTKVALLLGTMGEDCIDIFNSFKLSPEEANKFDSVVDNFSLYFEPKKNTVISRYKFFNCVQKENETIDSFVTNLKNLAKDCSFENQESSLIRDLLIIGIKDLTIKEKLLIDSELSLEKAVEYCRAKESSESQIKIMNEGSASKSVVHYIKNSNKMHKFDNSKQTKDTHRNVKNYQDKCQKCKTKHDFGHCPAWGKKCHKCHRLNHFSIACKNKKVYEVRDSDDDSSECVEHDSLILESIELQVQSVKTEWKETVIVEKTKVSFKIDSGAEVNILPIKKFNALGLNNILEESNKCLKSYTGHSLKVVGTCKLNCKVGNKSELLEFYVVNQESNALLGLVACEKLGFIHRNKTKIVNNIESCNFVQKYNGFYGKIR